MTLKGITILSLLFALFSCSSIDQNSEIEILDSKLFIDHSNISDNYKISVNTSNVLSEGIIIPFEKGQEKSTFKISTEIEISPEKKDEYLYKIYYQNASYKHNELDEDGSYNPKSAENFYGSWEDVGVGFKSLGVLEEKTKISILDSFRIVGNPRNEARYYGIDDKPIVNKALIERTKKKIRQNEGWLKSVEVKAKNKNVSVEKQIYLDALWDIDYTLSSSTVRPGLFRLKVNEKINEIMASDKWRNQMKEKAESNGISLEEQAIKDAEWAVKNEGMSKPINNRFKRNPRMGDYELMLVIISKSELDNLPEGLAKINVPNKLFDGFLNPFYYFKKEEVNNRKQVKVYNLPNKITASINLTGEKGIYIDPLKMRNPDYSRDFYSDKIGDSKELYSHALYEQYFHVINRDYKLRNVPLAADVINEPYGVKRYNQNKEMYPLDKRDIKHTNVTTAPGATVFYNDSVNAIQLINPGSASDFKKENTGVMTRVGVTYGKYTAKIKFPKIINIENVWNGVTCAFWLFSENMNDWNQRDLCNELGYMKKGDKSDSKDRYAYSTYSEIDIEIIKTSKHWPQSSYGGVDDYPIDTPADNHNLMVTTTNWDLGCRDPENYHQGVRPFEYAGKTFELHRWDYGYQALTSKLEYPHDKTVGDEFYYQIDWRPNEIIWRLGKTKEDMDIIGYMNSDYTKIPNNQMIAIITQEFHYSLWWPLAPFDQNNVPFPSNDINGYVYSVEIE